ncbi:hypothetical protein ACIBVL_29850 [Streptomyces sp. NPDC049687]|uniref:hypothetical protein n=1 Tax=Streptomyces sp. NPDC049687 TaxID=3365596 RepID=UPI00378E2D6F
MAPSVQAEIAQLCGVLRALRSAAADEGRGADVDRLVERARRGRSPQPELDTLLDDLGLLFLADGTREPWPWDDDGGHTEAEVYVCPAGRCARRWVRAPGVGVPRCDVDAVRLSLVDGD